MARYVPRSPRNSIYYKSPGPPELDDPFFAAGPPAVDRRFWRGIFFALAVIAVGVLLGWALIALL